MNTKLSDIKHDKHEVDASGQVLGRLATRISNLLVGKSKPYFVRHLDCGDFVTVKNAKAIKVTGRKQEKKVYTRFSGYPAGLKKVPMKNTAPEQVIRKAVLGMLPNNKLRDVWIARLKFI
ncbi:50S ribosomal protein L13 [Patescibacteria group bacterium]|nr:50S ribosomal protein L13 [Patescibacteria group bacterium]